MVNVEKRVREGHSRFSEALELGNRVNRLEAKLKGVSPDAFHQGITMVGQTIKVLVVEDNPQVADIVTLILTEYKTTDFQPEAVVTMEAALAKLTRRDHGYGLIILDLELPDSKGVTSVESVQKISPNTPIVVFTGHTSSIAAEVIRAGAQEFISKGDWDVKDLIDKVATAIIRHEVRGQFAAIDKTIGEMQDVLGKMRALERVKRTA